jgi:hypothetical protein
MSRCTGVRCEDAHKVKVPEDPEGPYRYVPQQCKNECSADSALCNKCIDWLEQYKMGKKGKWNGYINGVIPPESHVIGSEWNLKLRAKYAVEIAKKAMGEAETAPKAKKAAKKALEAVAEAKEARSNAVDAIIAAEEATEKVVKEVIRNSSSEGRSNAAGASMLRIAIPKSARRKTAKKSAAAARFALGMAEMLSSSSSPKARLSTRRKTAKKSAAAVASSPKKSTLLGMAEMYFSPKRRATTRRKTAKKSSSSAKKSSSSAKKSSNLMIYRPASAAPSPAAAAANGYRTPYASASPMPPSNAAAAAGRAATPYSSPAAAAVTGMANFYTNSSRPSSSSSSPSSSSSSSNSNFSVGSQNLTLA